MTRIPVVSGPNVVLAALALGLLLTEIDQSAFAAALPTVVGELGGMRQQLWVGTAYVLAGAIVMPVIGRLGDLVGRRTVLSVALLIFVAGSVVGGLAGSMNVLIAARVVQGLGAGGLLILVEAVVADLVAPNRRAFVLSVVGAVFAVASVTGPLVGGAFTDTVGWRWLFWLNVPLGLLAAAAAWRWIPRLGLRKPVRIDSAGTLCLGVLVVAGLLILVWGGAEYPWTSPVILGLTVIAGSAAVGLFVVERRAPEPVLPPGLLAQRGFVLAIVAGAVLAVAMFGTVNYLPTYLQMVHGLSPTRAGLFMLALIAGLGGATVVTGRIVQRTHRPKRWPAIGALLVAGAAVLGTQLKTTTPLPVVGVCLLLLGVGIGCAWEVLVVVVQDLAPTEDLGVATAVNGFVRELGVLVGTAWVGRMFTSGLMDRLGPLGQSLGMSPAAVRALPPDRRAEVAAAYADAFSSVFTWLLPVVVAAGVGLLLVPSRRLAGRQAAPVLQTAGAARRDDGR